VEKLLQNAEASQA